MRSSAIVLALVRAMATGPPRTMSAGSRTVGIGLRRRGRLFAPLIIAFAGSLAGCAPPAQLGSPEDAAAATNDFLQALTSGSAAYAWEHLTPETRDGLFDGNEEEFVRNVAEADWSAFEWQIGPVVDHDISWGVYVEVDREAVPDFLIDSGLASGFEGRGLVLSIQFPEPSAYVVAGRSMDIDLR